MGCCQRRESTSENKTIATNILQATRGESPTEHRLKVLLRHQCWDQLVSLTSERTEISTSTRLLWAKSPSTIGCLAITLLAIQALKDPKKIEAYFETLIPFLLKSIASGPDDLRENSLMLLSGFMPLLDDRTANTLLKNKAFNTLIRFLMCSKTEMTIFCARVCHNIYNGRPRAKKAFILENGHLQLIKLIQWSSGNLEYLSELLMCLHNLFVTSEEFAEDETKVACKFSRDSISILKGLKKSVQDSVLLEQLNQVILLLYSL